MGHEQHPNLVMDMMNWNLIYFKIFVFQNSSLWKYEKKRSQYPIRRLIAQWIREATRVIIWIIASL